MSAKPRHVGPGGLLPPCRSPSASRSWWFTESLIDHPTEPLAHRPTPTPPPRRPRRAAAARLARGAPTGTRPSGSCSPRPNGGRAAGPGRGLYGDLPEAGADRRQARARADPGDEGPQPPVRDLLQVPRPEGGQGGRLRRGAPRQQGDRAQRRLDPPPRPPARRRRPTPPSPWPTPATRSPRPGSSTSPANSSHFRKIDMDDPDARTVLDRITDPDGQAWLRSVHTHSVDDGSRPFARVEVLYDPETQFPLQISNYDWPAPGQRRRTGPGRALRLRRPQARRPPDPRRLRPRQPRIRLHAVLNRAHQVGPAGFVALQGERATGDDRPARSPHTRAAMHHLAMTAAILAEAPTAPAADAPAPTTRPRSSRRRPSRRKSSSR